MFRKCIFAFTAAMGFVSTAAGGTWEPGRTVTVDLPGDAHAAQVFRLNGEPRVVVTGTFGTWVINPVLGTSVMKSAVVGTAVWVDAEYDSTWPDVLVCGKEGLTQLATSSDGFSEPNPLVLQACRAVGLVPVDYQEYSAPVTAWDTVWLWEEDDEGYLRPKTQLGTVSAVPVIAVQDGEVAFAGLGDAQLKIMRKNSVITQPAGGFVGGVAWAGDKWAWTQTSGDSIQLEGGQRIEVGETPTRLVAGNLTGDGQTGFIVSHPRTLSIGFVSEGLKEVIHPVGVEGVGMSLGDWSGDTCSDLVIIANERKVLLVQGTCTASVSTPSQPVTAPPDTVAAPEPTPAPEGVPSSPADSTGDTVSTSPEVVAEQGGESSPEVVPVEGVTQAPEAPATSESVSPEVLSSTPEMPLAVPAGETPPLVSSGNILIGETWPVVTIPAGASAKLQVRDVQGKASAFAAMGGPPGFVVQSTGGVDFTPEVTHIGRWRVAVRMWSGSQWDRRGGFELVIVSAEEFAAQTAGTASVTAPAVVTEGSATTTPPAGTPASGGETPAALATTPAVPGVTTEAVPSGPPRNLSGCDIGLGLAVGATDVRDNWVFLNQEVQESVSPAFSFSCQDGRNKGYWWFAGMDSAPAFTYFHNERRRRHTLAATVGIGGGTHTFRAGAFATVGFVMLGVGPRIVFQPFQFKKSDLRHGFDLRGTVFVQNQFAGQVMLLYSFSVGDLWQ